MDSLKAAISSEVLKLRAEAAAADAATETYDQVWQHKREERDRAFSVTPEGAGAWRVTGRQVERMVVQTDWENEEAVTFLQHRMRRLGVDDALAEAGARSGDEVRICEVAFEYESAEGAEDIFAELDL